MENCSERNGEEMIWNQVKKIFEKNSNFILTTHVNSDGDGLGAELALYHYLLSIGKQVRIINPTPVSENYGFLFEENECETFDNTTHVEAIKTCDYVIVLDVAGWKRIGGLAPIIQKYNVPLLCIDHHPYSESMSKEMVIIDSASSTGELMYDLITSCGGVLTYPIALGVYTSFVNDTGNFRYSNTSAKVHEITSHLLEFGIRPDIIYSAMYEFHTASKLKFLGEVLSNLDFRKGGEILTIIVTKKMMKRHGLEEWQTEGLIDYPRIVKNGRIIAFACERKNELKVSLRARDSRVNVNIIASQFGGGGHRYASGISSQEPVESFLPKVLDLCEKQLEEIDSGFFEEANSNETEEDYFDTLKELCKSVLSVECQAAHFYLLLLGKVSSDHETLKEALSNLYRIETGHVAAVKSLFHQLLNWGETRFDIEEYIRSITPDMTSIANYPRLKEMIHNDNIEGILEIASSIEQEAIDHYRKMITENKDISKKHNYLNGLLELLVKEEEDHLKDLADYPSCTGSTSL